MFVILFGSPGCLIVRRGFVSLAFWIISESSYAVLAYIRLQAAKWIDTVFLGSVSLIGPCRKH